MAISYPNIGNENIYMDLDNITAWVARAKNDLTLINNTLVTMRKYYSTLANDSRTKGKVKVQAQKIVDNINKYINKNNALKQSLESKLTKSAQEYLAALQGFDQLSQYSDDIGKLN